MQLDIPSAPFWVVGGVVASGIAIWSNPLIAPLATGSAVATLLLLAIALWARKKG